MERPQDNTSKYLILGALGAGVVVTLAGVTLWLGSRKISVKRGSTVLKTDSKKQEKRQSAPSESVFSVLPGKKPHKTLYRNGKPMHDPEDAKYTVALLQEMQLEEIVKLQKQLEVEGDTASFLNTLYVLGLYTFSTFQSPGLTPDQRNRQLNESLQLFTMGLQVAHKLNSILFPQLAFYLAKIWIFGGQFDKSIQHFEAGLAVYFDTTDAFEVDISTEEAEDEVVGTLLENIGDYAACCSKLKQFARAAILLGNIAGNVEKMEVPPQKFLVTLYIHLSEVLAEDNRFEESMEVIEKARKTGFEEVKNVLMYREAIALNGLEKYEEAAELFDMCFDNLDELAKDKQNLVHLLGTSFGCYSKLKAVERGRAATDKALVVLGEESARDKGEILKLFGLLLSKLLKDNEKAKELLQEALSIFQSLDMEDEVVDCCSALGESYALSHEWEKAIEVLEKAVKTAATAVPMMADEATKQALNETVRMIHARLGRYKINIGSQREGAAHFEKAYRLPGKLTASVASVLSTTVGNCYTNVGEVARGQTFLLEADGLVAAKENISMSMETKISLAHNRVQAGELGPALKTVEEVLNISQTTLVGRLDNFHTVLSTGARVALFLEQYERARELAEKAVEELEKQTADAGPSVERSLRQSKSIIVEALARKGKHEEALKLLTEIQEEAENARLEPAVMGFLCTRARVHLWNNGGYEAAKEALSRAHAARDLGIYGNGNFNKLTCSVLLVQALLLAGDTTEAQSMAERAYQEVLSGASPLSENKVLLIKAEVDLAFLYLLLLKDTDKASLLLRTAEEQISALGEAEMLATHKALNSTRARYSALSALCLALAHGNFVAAQDRIKPALKLSKGDRRLVALVHYIAGLLLSNKANPKYNTEAAVDHLEQSCEAAAALNDTTQLALSQMLLSQMSEATQEKLAETLAKASSPFLSAMAEEPKQVGVIPGEIQENAGEATSEPSTTEEGAEESQGKEGEEDSSEQEAETADDADEDENAQTGDQEQESGEIKDTGDTQETQTKEVEKEDGEGPKAEEQG